jgi:hypothetical protein
LGEKNLRWDSLKSPPNYDPESFHWDDSYKTNSSASPCFKRSSLKPTMVARRIRWLRQRVTTGSDPGLANENIVAQLASGDVRHPRQANLDLDERNGGHTIHNHVLGSGTGVQEDLDIAFRAAFEMLPGRPVPPATSGPGPHAPAGLDGGRVATAFRNRAAADTAAQRARNYMNGSWVRWVRDRFAVTTNRISFHIRVPPSSLTGFRRRRALPYQDIDTPRHVTYGPRRLAPALGRRPLTPADLPLTRATAPGARPLTEPVSLSGRVLVLAKSTDNHGSGGWYILTMYPEA